MKTRMGYVSNGYSSSFIAFAPSEVFYDALMRVTEESRRILKFFLPPTVDCHGIRWNKLEPHKDNGELSINGQYVDTEEIEQVFDMSFDDDHHNEYNYKDQISDAMTQLIHELPTDRILCHEEEG